MSYDANFFVQEHTAAGLVFLDSSMAPLHVNQEAIDILTYPEDPANIESLENFLARKIRTVLQTPSRSSRYRFVSEFMSGRRRYHCRVFSLNSGFEDSPDNEPIFAVLMERPLNLSLDTSKIAEKFHLTQRERETLEFVLQGYTSKQIASRMKISPNTVNAFIKIIMTKTGTSTRAAIVGKILPPKANRSNQFRI